MLDQPLRTRQRRRDTDCRLAAPASPRSSANASRHRRVAIQGPRDRIFELVERKRPAQENHSVEFTEVLLLISFGDADQPHVRLHRTEPRHERRLVPPRLGVLYEKVDSDSLSELERF